ncbi:MAG: hypothetical protein RQ715_01535 [Methylococcales bacterium]|nr:hypothetical protein [Methylococcales bacterium]
MKKTLTLTLMGAALGLASTAFAHTRLEFPVIQEGTRSDNNIVVTHGCTDLPVIGTVNVFPDVALARVQTSTDNFVDNIVDDARLATDFMSGGSITGLVSREVFSLSELIKDPQGNAVGFWNGAGTIPASGWAAKSPVRIGAINIEPTSCATKVVVVPAIANICQLGSLADVTGPTGRFEESNLFVDLWTAPDAGSPFDGPAWNFPATLTVERDLENNPLPASCGEGFAVRVFPSAEQLDRDFKAVYQGREFWPNSGI